VKDGDATQKNWTFLGHGEADWEQIKQNIEA